MALRGGSSGSFLRSKDLISFSEIAYDMEGNNIIDKRILAEALARDSSGNFIRQKSNIANILNRYGVLYRMVFNAMNMGQYTYNDVLKAVEHLAEYIHDLGISGIVEFHASDKTQNSDHIHFWINSEDKLIYNKIAQEMVSMGYSNIEDVYIQKYEDNQRLDESEYVNSEDMSIEDRFATKPILYMEKIDGIFPSLRKKYNLIIESISELFQRAIPIKKPIEPNIDISKDCTLPKTNETNAILKRIKELKDKMSRR